MALKRIALFGVGAILCLGLLSCGWAGDDAKESAVLSRREFTIGWSSYVGWVPWEFAERAGIVKKWSDRYGIKIEVMQFYDYLQSLELFAAGKLAGVTAASSDALLQLAGTGRPGVALIVGDSSNGNDGILGPATLKLADLRGRHVALVEYSVSHFLLERALQTVGIAPEEVTIEPVSEAQVASVFDAGDNRVVATWNPYLDALAAQHGLRRLFDSTAIPDEILDLLVVDSKTLEETPALGHALIGIWYETLERLFAANAGGVAARAEMADLLGITLESFDAQLRSTRFFKTPGEAAAFISGEVIGASLEKTVGFVSPKLRKIRGETGSAGCGAAVDEKTIGDQQNITLLFQSAWLRDFGADGSGAQGKDRGAR